MITLGKWSINQFTLTGGLAAVIYTDTLQVVIMLVGGSFLMVTSKFEFDFEFINNNDNKNE